MEFNVFGVYLSDLDEDAAEHHYLGFQRTLPDPDADGKDNASEDEGFYIEFNGQESGCYQRATEQKKVTLIELSGVDLRVSFTPAANIYQGMIDGISDVPLSRLTVYFNFGAEQRVALRAAFQTVVGQDCEFRYTDSA